MPRNGQQADPAVLRLSAQVPGSEQAGWTRVGEAYFEPPGPYQLGEVDSNAWSLDATESPNRAVKC